VEPERKPGTDADAFWRKLILPEEDRRRLHPDQKWTVGYRWFRSPNVIPLEQFRTAKLREAKSDQA
jgi:hypothetical protein